MQITRINLSQPSKPQFKAVNQKYFEWAKKDYAIGGDISTEWLQRIRYDVCLFKEISPQDGIDTINAVKRLINKRDDFIEEVLKNFKYELKHK